MSDQPRRAAERAYFGTNLKMHQTRPESVAYITALAAAERPARDVQLFAIVPFTSLEAVVEIAHRANLWIGAQNMHWAQAGEYTGEVSAAMLRALGVDLVLLGHAERRTMFGETDALIRQKLEAALAHGLRVILCVGETADERRFGASEESVVRQLKIGLNGISDVSRVIVAYEPVWAIGEHGSAPQAEDIDGTLGAIRRVIPTVPLLYGGSITAMTAARYARIPALDGLFVGRAARRADGFADVLRAAFCTGDRASASEFASTESTQQ